MVSELKLQIGQPRLKYPLEDRQNGPSNCDREPSYCLPLHRLVIRAAETTMPLLCLRDDTSDTAQGSTKPPAQHAER